MTFRDFPKNRLTAETNGVTDFSATRVVKLGGSLLADELLETRLHHWLKSQAPCATLLVVGGGELADAVRQLDQRYAWPVQEAHDQAIRAMQVNAFVLSRLCPDLIWIEKLDGWRKGDSVPKTDRSLRQAILDPVPFLRNEEPALSGRRLPCGWQVTSDSIAARLAHVLGANELVLLKSTLPVHNAGQSTYQDAAAAGFVDQHFPLAAEQLPLVRVVNLRDGCFPEIRLTR